LYHKLKKKGKENEKEGEYNKMRRERKKRGELK
jgi:hypothetical protein